MERQALSDSRAIRFFDNDLSLGRMVAEFLHQGFEAGSPGLVIASAAQSAAIVHALVDRSVDVIGLQQSRDLLLLDAEEMLSRFMIDGKPDDGRFRHEMYAAIETVCRGRTGCTVRLFTQTADVLWRRGDCDAAVRLEVLSSQLAGTEDFSLLCRYALGNFFKSAGAVENPMPSSTASDTPRRRRQNRR